MIQLHLWCISSGSGTSLWWQSALLAPKIYETHLGVNPLNSIPAPKKKLRHQLIESEGSLEMIHVICFTIRCANGLNFLSKGSFSTVGVVRTNQDSA